MKVSYTILMDKEILDRAKAQAVRENRSINNTFETILDYHLDPLDGDKNNTPGIQVSSVKVEKFIANQKYYKGSIEEARNMYGKYVDSVNEGNLRTGSHVSILQWNAWLEKEYFAKKL